MSHITSKTGSRVESKLDFKLRVPAHKPAEPSKKLDDENRSLKIKLKSIESQLAKNEAEAASRIAKFTNERNALEEKSKGDVAAFEAKMKEILEKVEDANAKKSEVQKKLEQQEKKNEELRAKVEQLKSKGSKSDESASQHSQELEEYNKITRQIEKLKAQLKNSESANNPSIIRQKSKTKEGEMEELFKERSGHMANLQKCIAQAQTSLEQLQKEPAEESAENTPTASPHKSPNDKARPLRRRPTARTEIEKAARENKEWKERCNAMAQQLFEAKVAWADENNNYQKSTTDLNQVYTFAVTRLEQLKHDYASVKKEFEKIDKKRKKYLCLLYTSDAADE
eukprot:TRINITY_DN8365_c0_g1_i13.p1 TRINITY_DN8365_c0_g1~~TRINITY_DN8365_c0_g1_i13.p1  ORF type:complete len:340 (-),score=117.04 TRINITY_DN8365_c0_g1_i13:55-1074(-)